MRGTELETWQGEIKLLFRDARKELSEIRAELDKLLDMKPTAPSAPAPATFKTQRPEGERPGGDDVAVKEAKGDANCGDLSSRLEHLKRRLDQRLDQSGTRSSSQSS